MESEQRWCRCWEMLAHVSKRPVQIYRQYHRMDAFPPPDLRPVDPEWSQRYAESGVALVAPEGDEPLWWDHQIVDWLLEHGAHRFRKLDIWDVDWREVADVGGRAAPEAALSDTRGRSERRRHRWLDRTQGHSHRLSARWLQRSLILLGW